MLALAVLDRILSIDRQNQWLVYLCNSGYLRVLVESLRQDDATLQGLLTPQPPLLKPLYIYESKMVRCAPLIKFSKTSEYGVFENFSQGKQKFYLQRSWQLNISVL